MAVDASGNVYVADQQNCRVQKFTGSGAFVTKWGTAGWGPGQLQGASGIAASAQGDIYVSDYLSARIERFTSEGSFLGEWGTEGSGNGQLSATVYGLAVDGAGNVLVADTQNDRIEVFGPSGAYLFQWGSRGTEPGQVNAPLAISVGPDGFIYVTNVDGRVQEFGFGATAVRPRSWGWLKAGYR